MRKVLLLSVLLLFSYLSTYAAKEDSFVLYQGFEQTDGDDFSLWTQEYVSGNQSWQVMNNAQSVHPSAAHQGEHYILLRNQTEETLAYTTRLVTPVLNIGNEVISPVLIFWRAQEQRTGDIDTLRVWYRTSLDGGWAPLKTYSDRTRGWVSDTVPLLTVSPTYQLAFEASDNMGWGVALDDITVRPAPVCETPTNLSIRKLSDVGVTLDWLGSLDTEEFMVVLASQQLPIDSVEADEYKQYWVKDTIVNDLRCHFADEDSVLTGGTKYWAYVKSICPTEVSDFAELAFQSITSIAEVPFIETFNYDYKGSTYPRPSTWAYGRTIAANVPVVNQGTTVANRYQYSHDGTSALIFSESASASTARLDAGEVIWAVAPLMNNVALKDLEVTFWGGVNSNEAGPANHKPANAGGIIVGVMNDPYDFETFEPVDTAAIYNDWGADRFTVSLAGYEGTGKYIAFASNFEELQNYFALNEVRIDYNQKVRVEDVKVSNVLSDSLTIDADLIGATAVNIVLAKHVDASANSHFPMEFPYLLPQDSIITTLSNQALPARIGLPAQDKGCFVQVYVQAVNGNDTSMWAVPQKIQLPAKYTAGDTLKISFEEVKNTPDTWRNVGRDNLISGSSTYKWYPYNVIFPYVDHGLSIFPTISTSGGQDGKQMITLDWKKFSYIDEGYSHYLALPQVDTIQDVSLVFYMQGNTTCGKLNVGVMTDPHDISTFEPVASFTQTSTKWNRHEVRFADYAGTGKFICLWIEEYMLNGAIKAHSVKIDNIQIMPAPECPLPTGMEALPADTTAEFTWNKGTATQWQVEVFTKYAADTQTPSGSIAKAVVDTPYYEVSGLQQHTTYYYQVSTVCADTTIAAEVLSFETECLPMQALPYTENFSAYTTAKKTVATVPYCWTMPIMGTSSAYYPTVYNTGGKTSYALYFGADSTAAYFALPKLDAVLSEIQFNFWAKAATAEAAEQYLLVGIMTDPEDTTTFTAVDTLRFTGTAYKEYFVTFENYNGPDGYIAVLKPNNEKVYYYFDDIYINTTPTCTKIENVSVSNVGPTGATLRWTKSNADKWEVLVASKSLTEAVLKTVTPTTAGVVLCDTVDTNPYVLNDTLLAEKKTYYVYVRGVCSETDKAEWSNVVSFTTVCAPRSIEELKEDFATATNMNCWLFGKREGTSTSGYSAARTGQVLLLKNGTANDGAYAIMPAMDIADAEVRKLRLSFDAHAGKTRTEARQMMVGIMTDPTDWSTFIALKYITFDPIVTTPGSANNYAMAEALRYDVSFADYKGDANGNMGKYVAFVSVSDKLANQVYIDNISLAEEIGCVSPVEVTITDIEDTRAVLRWEHQGDTCQVQLTDKPMTDDTHIVLQDTVAVADTIQLEGLTGLTTYYVYVRTQCEGGETSKWTNMRSFKTACEPSYSIPYTYGFENSADLSDYDIPCWNVFYREAMNEYDLYLGASSSAKHADKKGLTLLSSLSDTAYAVSPKLDTDLNRTMLRFFYKVNSAASGATVSNQRDFAIGIASNVSCKDSLLATLTIVDSISATYEDGWMEYVNVFSDYAGNGHHYVLIGYNGGKGTGAGRYGVYIDDFEVTESPACITPISLEATRITSSEVTFTWEQPIQKVKTWEAVAVLADEKIDETKAVRVDTTEATLTGLQHTSDYHLYVRAVCGEGNVSEWSDPLEVSTLCLIAPDAAIWDFEGGKDDLECWTLGNTKSTSTSYIPSISKNTSSSVYAKSGEQALKIYTTTGYTVSTGAYAIMPEIDADLDTMQLRFSGRAVRTSYSKGVFSSYYTTLVGPTYAHAVEVGVLSDPSDWDTFESLYVHEFKVVDAKPQVEGDHWEDIALPLYGAKGKYIVFRSWFDKQNEIYLDDIIVEPAPCARPVRVAVNDTTLTDKHADFTWSSAASEWNVRITEALTGNVVAEDKVATDSYSIDTLQTATSYIFAVQSACANEDSDWTEIEFNTAYSLDVAHWNFEDNLYQFGTAAANVIPQHWSIAATKFDYSSLPYARANTSSRIYAHNPEEEVGQSALFFMTSTSNEQFAILPQLAFDLEDLALHFYARATDVTKSTGKIYTGNANYQRYLVLGTVEGTDVSTFVPLDTIRYDHVLKTSNYVTEDETGNKYWQEYSVPMRNYIGTAKRIAIKSPKANNQIHIDDVDFIPAGFCNIVTGLKVDDIHTTQVALHWNNEDQTQMQLQVATDKDYTEESLLKDVTLSEASYIIDGLQAQRNYYFRLKRLCDVDKESEWCPSLEFRTADTIQFYQDFSYVTEEEKRQQPLYWERYDRSAAKVMDQNMGIGNPISLTTTGSWRRGEAGVGLEDSHIYVEVFGNSTYDWLVSPLISLEEVATEKLVLSFDAALTGNLDKPAKEPKMDGTDDKFIVAVSLDEGKTWLRENTIVWSNDSTDAHAYVFNEIPYEGRTYYVDFTKYAGKVITLGFYVESTENNVSNYLHLDNVALNRLTTIPYAASICRWNDYDTDRHFDIDAYDLQLGTTEYQRFYPAHGALANDSLYVLTLTVNSDTTVTYNATVCEGEAYTEYGFDIQHALSGTYKRKLQGVNTCDSTVVLNLTVLPKMETRIEATICQGNYYEFNGEKYYTSTVHTDTLSSLVTGCDSIVTLYLTVTPALTGSEEVHLCPGTSINFGKFGDITASGVYVDTLQTALGCDSIVTLTVHQEEAKKTFIRAAICHGEEYRDDVFRGLSKPGDYTSNQETVYGCDSTVTLHLIIAAEDLTLSDTVSVAQLPYVLNGVELLSADTEEGVYTKKLMLGCGEVWVTITVGEPTGLGSTFVNSLAVAPNPVEVGTPVRVLTPFADSQINGMVLSVYDATGMLVGRQYPTATPIIIEGLPAAGVYLVSIQADGKTYQTKLVVK